ncbi:SDR family oxidoreductase [Frondihabitans australicus]|uniref:3-oxoacyl-[acyl-carrier protein] reductase n=1 Tax=Frondihabitans australicus TaxID=386892 RepID=A0A495IME9_9MICO|nr:SDR family oxidoreductase [Frondihabitans australicus]RKR76336.1 3-oxoacyl-[acyl-carrier protein] reductase [Frondihabitans australicus]
MKTTTSRIALVTGGSGTLGGTISRRLAADGMCVAVHYFTHAEKARDIVDQIIDDGGEAIAVAGDITDEANMRYVFDMVLAEYGGVDVVVHTASRTFEGLLSHLDLRAADQILKANILGTLTVNQLALQLVRDGGAIVNMASADVRLTPAGRSITTASHAAVEALSMTLAREARGRNITVNSVSPGSVATPQLLEGKDGPALTDLAKDSPLERLGQPSDIAEVVSLLAGRARWLNGQNLHVNGGTA